MKSRFIVLMVLIFVAALFTGCATTGDLEKLSAGQGCSLQKPTRPR